MLRLSFPADVGVVRMSTPIGVRFWDTSIHSLDFCRSESKEMRFFMMVLEGKTGEVVIGGKKKSVENIYGCLYQLFISKKRCSLWKRDLPNGMPLGLCWACSKVAEWRLVCCFSFLLFIQRNQQLVFER